MGQFSVIFFFTFNRAIFLGVFLAFSMLLSTRFSGYFRAKSSSFSSANLLFLFSSFVHILTILKLREYGIDLVILFFKYSSVFFLNKFLSVLPFLLFSEASKNGIYVVFAQSHWCSFASLSTLVCTIVRGRVNLIKFFKYSMELFSCSYKNLNRSSRNLLNILKADSPFFPYFLSSCVIILSSLLAKYIFANGGQDEFPWLHRIIVSIVALYEIQKCLFSGLGP